VSDARLRQLERAYAESGALADERALLHARLQAGALEREALALAAYCGSAVALELGGPLEPAPPTVEDWFSARGWGEGLLRWGQAVPTRAVLAILTPVLASLPEREPSRLYGDGLVESALRPRLLDLLAELEAWALEPCARTQRRVRRSARDLAGPAERFAEVLTAARAAHRDPWAQLTARERELGRLEDVLRRCARAVSDTVANRRGQHAGVIVSGALFLPRGGLAEGQALATGELIAWALGHGDPLRDRVEARG